MNPVTAKKRKKLRHARHKREAIRYHDYLNSPKAKEDLHRAIREFVDKQEDMPEEFVEIVNKNFNNLI